MELLWFVTMLLILGTVIQAVASFLSIKEAISSHGTKKPNRILLGLTAGMLVVSGILAYFSLSSNTSAVQNGSTLPPRQATFPSTVIPTLTLTPTPAPKVVQVNRQLTCLLNQGSNCVIAITVTSFLLDSAQNQTEMMLSIQAQQDCPQGFFENSAGVGLYLQDSTGKTYQSGGQLKPYNHFSVAQGQTLSLTATYPFVPSPGSTYTLESPGLECDGAPFQYASTQFSF